MREKRRGSRDEGEETREQRRGSRDEGPQRGRGRAGREGCGKTQRNAGKKGKEEGWRGGRKRVCTRHCIGYEACLVPTCSCISHPRVLCCTSTLACPPSTALLSEAMRRTALRRTLRPWTAELQPL